MHSPHPTAQLSAESADILAWRTALFPAQVQLAFPISSGQATKSTPVDARRTDQRRHPSKIQPVLSVMSEFSFVSDSGFSPLATPEGSIIYTPDASISSLDTSASMIEIPPPTPSHDSALSSVSEGGSGSDDDGDAEEEWQESLRQLELLISMVIVPFFGKWVGRRTAYWTWAKFMTWKYPVDVVITNRAAFNLAGAVSAASVPL